MFGVCVWGGRVCIIMPARTTHSGVWHPLRDRRVPGTVRSGLYIYFFIRSFVPQNRPTSGVRMLPLSGRLGPRPSNKSVAPGQDPV